MRRQSVAPSDSFIRRQYRTREIEFVQGCRRDRADVREGLERERSFTADWLRLSTNHIWSKDPGPPVTLFQSSVQEYRGGGEDDAFTWPRGRDVKELGLYGQIWDYFLFMWAHTRPYKAVFLLIVLALTRPFQTLAISFVASEIQRDPKGVPLWLYFIPFFGKAFERLLYWWYEIYVPLNSQRYQLRCVLLTQRSRLPPDHELAKKWPQGRFTGLMKDVDELVNGVWASCLQIIEDMISLTWIIALCMLNLALAFEANGSEKPGRVEYGAYIGLFLGLGIFVMTSPFLWFHFYKKNMQECETMIRDGQALYMSAADHALMSGERLADKKESAVSGSDEENPGRPVEKGEGTGDSDDKQQLSIPMVITGRNAFRIFGLTTFRAFFFRLAMTTNITLLSYIWGPLCAYGLLTAEGFGASENVASTLIVLLSLKDMQKIGGDVLSMLSKMTTGCLVLENVAELINADFDDAVGNSSDASKSAQPASNSETEFSNS